MSAIDYSKEQDNLVIPDELLFLATLIFSIVGGAFYYFGYNTSITIIPIFFAIFPASYWNWRYFSMLDEEEVKSVRPILLAVLWIIIVWLLSLRFTISFLTILGLANNLIISGICVFVVTFIILFINLWFPRYRRKEYLYEKYKARNRSKKYQKLLKDYYSVSKITPPDWRPLKREATQAGHGSKMSFEMKLKLLDLQLAESQNVLAFNAFVQTDTKRADLVSNAILLLPPFISYGISVSQGLMANYLTPILGISNGSC